MSRFSERMGIVKVALQTEGMDDPLRNSICNFVSEMLKKGSYDYVPERVKAIAVDVLRVPAESVGYQGELYWLLNNFPKLPWYTVYEILEYLVVNAPQMPSRNVTVAD